jgi:predicted GNAT family acetyltransferase
MLTTVWRIKPFTSKQVIAGIHAVLWNRAIKTARENVLTIGTLCSDRELCIVRRHKIC